VLAAGTTARPKDFPGVARRIKVLTLKEKGGAVAFDTSEVTVWLCVPPEPHNAELVFRSAMSAAIKRAVGV